MRLLAYLLVSGLSFHLTGQSAIPQVLDNRLRLELFAEHPDIVTPIGLATRSGGQLFVIESHTHLPPADYAGPSGDRVRLFIDADGDGRAEKNLIFAENLEAAMNLTITLTGRIFVIGARAVWELIDADEDYQSEATREILRVETDNRYPHSCLLGITHTRDGWLFLGRGNNGSAAYTMVGSDGSTVSGYGDGGNITRCRFDGSQLSEFATGFWNPFDLEFSQDGYLLAVDNDPDARGPNRLVDVVEGGDYGYQSQYGGSGNHPYQGWDGQLPGTLPFISGTGEAPSGLLDARRASLPTDYQNSVLVTVWNEHTIERHQIQPRGSSLQATASVLIKGTQSFRPVAIDADDAGNVFITDWVQVDYPNHGQGRIWRLSPKSNVKTTRAEPYRGIARKTKFTKSSRRRINSELRSEDPFRRHQAIQHLCSNEPIQQSLELAKDRDPQLRLAALLALKKRDLESGEALFHSFLEDPDPSIRQAALQWIGEKRLTAYRDQLVATLHQPPVTQALFATYLATTAVLRPDYIEAMSTRKDNKANRIPRVIDPLVVKLAIESPDLPPDVRALAVIQLPHTTLSDGSQYLLSLLDHTPEAVRRQVIRSLSDLTDERILPQLTAIATNNDEPLSLRRECLVALERFAITDLKPFCRLTQSTDLPLVTAALRLLTLYSQSEEVKQAVNRCYVIHRNRPNREALLEQLEDMLYPEPGCCQARVTFRPQRLEEWQHSLSTGGNPMAGEAVFYSIKSGCAQCHQIDGRGGRLGPDLSNAGQSVDRAQLVHSILRPSDQFPPQFQAWVVETNDGEEHRGLQLDHKAKGAIELFTLLGKTEHFEGHEIARYYSANQSLMPDGLEGGLSTSELRDLVAFLESRQ